MGPSRDDDTADGDSAVMRSSDDHSAQHTTTSPRRRGSSAAVSTTSQSDERDDTRTSSSSSMSSRKTLPPFVDSDETFHFFNDDMVLRTNAIRIVDDASTGARTDQQHTTTTTSRRRGGASGRSTRTAVDDDDDEDDEDYDEDDDECYSDEYYDDDDYDDDDADDEQRDARHESESDDDVADASRNAIKARKSTKRLRLRPSEWSSALLTCNSLRSERIPDLAPRYDDVFDAFDDLYDASDATRLTDQQAHAHDRKHPSLRKRSHSAQSAVATFVRRAHAAKSYRYRKQCEFLRVCYQRALETEPLLEDAEASASAVDAATAAAATGSESDETRTPAPAPSTALLRATRKEDLVETTVPTLHPRKWPHLPFRSPLLWRDSIDDAVAFLTHLADLPDASLQYEPIDVDAFVRDVQALLHSVSATDAPVDGHSALLPEAAVAGLAALLGMGVQLQSFALLTSAALQLMELGKTTRLDDTRAIRPSLKSVVDEYWRRLVTQSTRPAFAATYSRGLVAQWKISASPPSTSDAIATDGRYLYVFGRMGLFKIGTGSGNTVRDFVYAHNRTYARTRDAERSWLCCIGAYLYCRTIMMPSNRVDRIAVDTLERVDELYFSPNRSVGVKGVSESSVYAMLTDGTHLYTIRCVDTLKRSAAQTKASSERTAKSPAPPAPLSGKMLKSSSSGRTRGSSSEALATDATINVGDRVVRGPDWKWGSQDGVEGSVGTVERVSTWGGVPGSGVTVRWDKSQRVNTYRWGAESCYDLVIVVDNNGTVLERKDLPSKQTSKDASAASKASADAPVLPRHQFVLFQHDVSRIGATMDLDEDDLDVFLDLSTFGADAPGAATGTSGAHSTALGDTALISALHSHALSLCDWKSSWMCDGGLATCSGNNAAKRYRCDSGCDFDLCEACVRGTLIAKETTDDSAVAAAPVATEDKVVEGAVAETSDASASSDETAPRSDDAITATDAPSPDADAQATSDGSASPSSPVNLESNPFAIFHASLFYDDASSSAGGSEQTTPTPMPPLERVASESDSSSTTAPATSAPDETSDAAEPATGPTESSATSTSDAPAAEAKEKSPQEQEQDLVAELFAFWGGLYTRKECLVALRRNNFALNDAAIWISQCASDLRKQLLVPTVSSVTLTAKPGTSALDPVLLVAGSFFMSSGQLCIVSPPGLFTVGEHQSEKLKRAVTSYDAAWFFSVETGAMLSDDERDDALPVFLRGIPAGSPTCVDATSSQIFVYSGYLNCLEVYIDPAQRVAQSCVERSRDVLATAPTLLSDMGEQLFAQLHLLMLQRWSLPAYKHARAGLQEILFRTEREPTPAASSSTTKPTATAAGDSSAYSSSGHKSKARRIKNIRGRIQMLEATGQRDPPGYFVPFAIDFRDDSVVHLFRALVASSAQLCDSSTDADDDLSKRWRLVHDVLSLLHELSSELDFASVGLASDSSDAAIKTLFARTEDVLLSLARGDCGRSVSALLRSKVIQTAQALLAWGIRKSVFCREKKARMVIDVGERIVATLERDSIPLVAPARLAVSGTTKCDSHLLQFANARDCEYSLLESLLRCPMDAGRVDVAEFVPLDFDEFTRMLATLFKLAALEFDGILRSASPRHAPRVNQLTTVTKALHSLMNYCSVRLYNDRDESFESKAKAKESARVSPSELFNAFALACVRSCTELLTTYRDPPSPTPGLALAHLQSSVVGTILPVVLTTVSNYPAAASVKVRHGLVELLQALDKVQAQASTTAVDAPLTDAHFECDHVVESPHPYSQTQSSFRRVVRIPGARALHIDFDPRSCTSGEADFVFITSGRSWFSSDRVAFGDSGIGDNGGCFFGSFAHGNWPTQGLTIVGDTATIMLCATSQARDATNVTQSAKLRWGLRCTVRGLVAPAPASWLHDVSASVACACSVIAEHLMQSVAVQPVEVQCRKWLTSRELFRALDRSSALEVRRAVERRNDVVETLSGVARLHKAASTSTNAKWSDALGYVAAALVAQTDRAVIASVVARLTAAPASLSSAALDDSVQRSVQAIATELQRVEQWMLRHVQLLNEWHYLELDCVAVDEMKERYADNHDRLRELCELQSVAFHSADVNGCITRLHAALVSHAAKTKDDASASSHNAYQVVATEVIEKAQLLLARYTREKALSDAASSSSMRQQSASDDAASRSISLDHALVATAGDFFRSTVAASALSDCVQIQSRRLRDRIAGFSLSESVISAIATSELASFFVGRAIVALSNASAGETDYVSGCALGDASLLIEFDALLRKRHASTARLANDASKSLVLRAIAVADALCAVPSADNERTTQFIADGLTGTTTLIRAADAALGCESIRSSSSDNIHCQTSNAVWILHRLLQEHSVSALDAISSDQQHVTPLFAATRSLFAYYDAMVESPLTDATTLKTAFQMLGRILRIVLPSLGRIAAVRSDATWWIEQALRLVVRSDAPVSVSIAATRFVRSAITLSGDRIFDLDVALRGSESGRIALGRDLPSVLIARVGALVSLLPTASSVDPDASNDSSEQFCVVIFQSDETVAKLGVAIEKVAPPDIRHLNMQLEALESSTTTPAAPVKIAESETASASMIHRSVRCDGCEMSPLRGYRFKCFTCPNYDLCAECYTGEKHNLDHEFIRLSDSSSGMGDVLQPRSKGGGTVPETSLVGSKHWKGSIVKVHVTMKGYALYRLGSAPECLATAKELAEIGCLATVMEYTELQAIDRVFGWECQLAAAVEPGSARAGRRAAAAQKSAQQKADRATIRAMNAAICSSRAKSSTTRRMADVLALASEVIATVRSVLSDRNDVRQWRNSTFQALARALDYACDLLEMPSLDGRECHRRYFEAIGVANVLGGFVEPMRVGGAVARVHGTKTEPVRFGTLQAYALGNSAIQVCVPPALSARTSSDAARSSVVESAVPDVTPVAEIPLRVDVIKTLEHLAPSFCAVIKRLHGWLLSNKPSERAQECLYRSELGCAFMRSFACMAPHWTSLFDNQIISTHGNIPALLFHLAQLCLKDVGLGNVESERDVVWQMEWVVAQRLQYALATRPIKRKSFSAVENADCIFEPPPPTESGVSESSSTETFYNLYAYSSRSDIPQHSGRNKLLEYWEKNVIPAIESYVSGSFKSYEMDYFFAQLREPLREGNSAAALKIAYTLCDGHVPSGCVYPDRDTDWSALQIDEVEVGGRYLISTETLESSGWPQPMLWTVGHSGVVRLVNPSGMILLDVLNPVTSEMENWWYHVDSLKPCGARVRSFADHSVVDFDASRAQLLTMNKQLMCSIARKSIFELLQVAPDHVMSLSIGRKAVAAASAVAHRRPASSVFGNRYSLSELLRLAATADLECPDKVAGLDVSFTESSSSASASLETSDVAVKSAKHAHISMLQSILNKHFDRPAADRALLSPRPADEVLPLISKKQTKPVKGASASSASLKTSSSQPKLSQQPDAEPPAAPGKYRYMLMEALLHELKQCLDASAAFLQASSFSVASESPPQPVALVHVPGATCLVLSFVVHPVLMDLPPGSSLEFFRDEKCTDRIFGYFGEKKGLNYLPPLVVAGDRCYVKISQGMYARYKFRVDALTSDFGLALWIGEELYQKLLATPFSAYEVETLLSTLVSAFVEYLATAMCLPCSAKIPVLQLVAKLVNFALGRGILTAVPITKLASPLVKELSAVVETERTTQQGRYSLYTQQLAELLALLEEVSSLKSASSSSLVSGSWWAEYVRMAAFTRALVHGKREATSPEAFSRIYCGRSPTHEIDSAHRAVSTSDLYCERLILVQKLPKTTRVDDLRAALSRLVLHLSLEECGEADDQSVYSAAEVTRFGIVSKVLHLPVDDDGVTKGYAIVDVGREDIISNLLVRIPSEKLEFEGERSVDDADLAARIASLGAKASSESAASNSEPADASQDEQVWSCSVCTLENSIAESECAACGSPIPPELATINRDLASHASSSSQQPSSATDEASSSPGWACHACTFLNSWGEPNCLACSLERSADQVPPAPATETSAVADSETTPSGDAADGAATESNVFHELSAVRFSDALQVAETDDVPQVADFVRHLFVTTASDGSARIVDAFVDVLRAEVLQSTSSRESKQAIDAFTSLLELKCCCDEVGADAFLAQATTRALDAVRTQPMDLVKWLRRAGYDLQFDLNHYATVDAARQAQAKWTFPMDCQLLAMCKALSSSIGVLTLSELCPSHIRAKTHAHEHHLLAHLETRDLRLRFTVLKALNRLLLHALPLVNLRPWSDPNALRSRIVSIRQLLFPGVKIRFFAQTQDNTSLGCGISAPDSGSKRPMVTLDRRKIFGRRTLDAPLSLADPKRSLFASTMAQLSAIPPAQLRAKRPTGASDPFVAFIVLFAGENVVGEGGPYRQLFHDIASELLSPGNALFIPTPNNATKIGEYRERFIPKPSSTSKELLRMFEFVGLLMGCSLRTGVRLNIRLAPIVWKMLVKQSLAFTDLESVDYSLCESLKYLEAEAADSSLAPSDVLYESFTATRSDGTVVELKPHGRHIPVTKDNCKEYIRLVKASRLQECKPQVDAMLRGISKIVPVQLLQLCVWTELQQWICGSLDINVELLKRHTRYASGMSPDKFPHLEMFWRVLAGFSEENKRRFINFAWGQDTLPADDAEFDRTHTRLLIKAPPTTATSHDALLPKADTCFFNIELPAYSSDAVMHEKLLLAITLCTSLDGDDQTGHVDIYYAGDDGEE